MRRASRSREHLKNLINQMFAEKINQIWFLLYAQTVLKAELPTETFFNPCSGAITQPSMVNNIIVNNKFNTFWNKAVI